VNKFLENYKRIKNLIKTASGIFDLRRFRLTGEPSKIFSIFCKNFAKKSYTNESGL